MNNEANNKKKFHILVIAAMMTAFCCIATMFIHIPSPTGGYINLGDVIVLMGAYLLGPWWGAAVAGLGSALADLIAGYPVYIPATFLIKAIMSLVAAKMYSLFKKKGVGILMSGLVAETIMILGYWLYDGLLMGSLIASASGIPSNLVQGAVAIILSLLLTAVLEKNIKRYCNE